MLILLSDWLIRLEQHWLYLITLVDIVTSPTYSFVNEQVRSMFEACLYCQQKIDIKHFVAYTCTWVTFFIYMYLHLNNSHYNGFQITSNILFQQ
jgi:hypothetical protein